MSVLLGIVNRRRREAGVVEAGQYCPSCEPYYVNSFLGLSEREAECPGCKEIHTGLYAYSTAKYEYWVSYCEACDIQFEFFSSGLVHGSWEIHDRDGPPFKRLGGTCFEHNKEKLS